MKRFWRSAVLALFTIGCGHGAASAAQVLAQSPCQAGTDAVCRSINSNSSSPFNLRGVTIESETASEALLNFHGSMLCSNSGSIPRVVDLVTQIVNDPSFSPVIGGRGGARHAAVILNSELGTTVSFNLATTVRVDLNVGGVTSYYFRVKRLRLDPEVRCIFYNNTFSLISAP